MAGWITIAKNEVRKYTSKFRKNRKVFWSIIFIIVVIVCVSIPLITHAIVDPIIQNILAEMGLPAVIPIPPEALTALLPWFIPIAYLSFLLMFVMSLLYPVQYTLQELNIGHLEVLLSAPIRPRDMLFGEFVGQLPILS
ncbi:MAG: hypothetical protein ACTSX4_10645, partial [Candidatus Helarchaeota archaeon]